MSEEPSEYENIRHSRIRRVKKVLRYMPRKATLHRYPFLNRFADMARKRSYLWSFRTAEVVPALYAGFILTFVPLYGVQIPLAFALALLFRANLMVLVALQFISNPVTVPAIYLVDYQLGTFILDAFRDMGSPPNPSIDVDMDDPSWVHNISKLLGETFLGGAIIGYFFGFVSSFFYQFFAKRLSRESRALRKHKRKKEAS